MIGPSVHGGHIRELGSTPNSIAIQTQSAPQQERRTGDEKIGREVWKLNILIVKLRIYAGFYLVVAWSILTSMFPHQRKPSFQSRHDHIRQLKFNGEFLNVKTLA